MRRIGLGLGLTLLPLGAVDPVPATLRPEVLVPPPAYYRPVIVDGFTFPVARSNWLSVIETGDDWHDPRFRLIDGRWQLVGYHEGNDIVAEEGTPVLATTGGTVEAVGWTFYSGTRVGVRGTDGKYYFYAHLSEVAPGIVPGAPVDPGTMLGRVGNTGYGPPGREDQFPPHLHFGIEGPGGWENPYPLVRRLYRASVAATERGEARLAEAARAGDAALFERLVAELHADPG
ncbi:MAG TPA: M23 family metallopeptidase [Actinomycetota bacterium]|nr:M23 family metallopeptidase [Actinomycetota bacterium]